MNKIKILVENTYKIQTPPLFFDIFLIFFGDEDMTLGRV